MIPYIYACCIIIIYMKNYGYPNYDYIFLDFMNTELSFARNSFKESIEPFN